MELLDKLESLSLLASNNSSNERDDSIVVFEAVRNKTRLNKTNTFYKRAELSILIPGIDSVDQIPGSIKDLGVDESFLIHKPRTLSPSDPVFHRIYSNVVFPSLLLTFESKSQIERVFEIDLSIENVSVHRAKDFLPCINTQPQSIECKTQPRSIGCDTQPKKLCKDIQSQINFTQSVKNDTQHQLNDTLHKSNDTQHQLNDTQHLLNDTQHQSNDTQHLLNVTQHQSNDTQYSLNNTQHQSNKTQHPINDTQHQSNDTRSYGIHTHPQKNYSISKLRYTQPQIRKTQSKHSYTQPPVIHTHSQINDTLPLINDTQPQVVHTQPTTPIKTHIRKTNSELKSSNITPISYRGISLEGCEKSSGKPPISFNDIEYQTVLVTGFSDELDLEQKLAILSSFTKVGATVAWIPGKNDWHKQTAVVVFGARIQARKACQSKNIEPSLSVEMACSAGPELRNILMGLKLKMPGRPKSDTRVATRMIKNSLGVGTVDIAAEFERKLTFDKQ